MSHSHAANSPEVFDETDPHGQHHHGQHESHVIVGPALLRSVLFVLLLFTVLTVGIAQAEIAIENWLGIVLPWWINVVGAMSIAVVKSLLVMAYFMQLKYDNPMNTVLMMFCFFALGLFLMFTGLDLFTRSWVYDFKAGAVVAGGTGNGVNTANGKPLVIAAKERFKNLLGNDEVREYLIVAGAVHEVANSGGEGTKELRAFADHLTDLHSIMVHPPEPGAQGRIARELEEKAGELRGAGKGPAADQFSNAAKRVSGLKLAEAKASYSVESQFEMLAAQAHGGHGTHHDTGSTANQSRAKTGLTLSGGAGGGAHEQGAHH